MIIDEILSICWHGCVDGWVGVSVGERLQAVIDAYGGGGFIKLSVGFEQYFKVIILHTKHFHSTLL